jgi:hypothetical protein
VRLAARLIRLSGTGQGECDRVVRVAHSSGMSMLYRAPGIAAINPRKIRIAIADSSAKSGPTL